MRGLLNGLLAITCLALLAGAAWQGRAVFESHRQQETARAELHRFQQQIALHTAIGPYEHGKTLFPVTIDPQWFNGNLPENPLLDDTHPWLEIAAATDRSAHPRELVADDCGLAKFWYCPATGMVRARVPAQISDAATIELYNSVNESSVTDMTGAESPQR